MVIGKLPFIHLWRWLRMKTKTFDCVQMKRRGAEAIRSKLKGKSIEHQLKHWRKGTEELKKLQQKLRKRS